MRLTSLAVPAALFLAFGPSLLACTDPPSSEGSTSEDATSTDSSGDGDGDDNTSPQIICSPGETQCLDESTLQICAPTGLEWEDQPCEDYEECDASFIDQEGNDLAACVGPCERLEDTPSSEGCSFFTTSMYQATLPPNTPEPPDAIVVGNPQDVEVQVTMEWIPFGSNKAEPAMNLYDADPDDGVTPPSTVVIPPNGLHVFELDPALTIYQDEQETSLFRSGSVYHLTSQLPVVAYLHAPYTGQNSNASTLLLPESVLQKDYVVYNHGAWQAPNYFIVIATQDQTTVSWKPLLAATAGDALPLPFVDIGETGEQLMNRFDNIRIDTTQLGDPPKCERDLSGTIISADKPIWVVSAIRGLRLPWCGGSAVDGCDTIIDTACNYGSDFAMEQNLPLDYWGREYIAPHSPSRGGEDHVWRVFAGEDDITINVDPPQPGWPVNLASRGEFVELIVPNNTNLVFTSSKVFMPVQYVTGHYTTDNDMGSPAMTQVVPTEQFLDSYTFVTGSNFDEHWVQIIREQGGADVTLDGELVTDAMTQNGWEPAGNWEIGSVLITEGGHTIRSDDFFGIMQYGYSPHIGASDNSAGYGYMGGMKAEVIFIP